VANPEQSADRDDRQQDRARDHNRRKQRQGHEPANDSPERAVAATTARIVSVAS
jgi:hypothetical protein